MNKQFNIDNVIKKANSHKEDLLDKKELPSNIDEHPIDKLDILIAECNPENCDKTIEDLKKITAEHPELIGELLEEMDSQKMFANLEKGKCDSIEDPEAKTLAKYKWDDKLRALVSLREAIDRRSEDRDE